MGFSKHTLSAVFLVLALITGAVAIFSANPPVVATARIFAFVFGLLFFVFLIVGLVGRVKN